MTNPTRKCDNCGVYFNPLSATYFCPECDSHITEQTGNYSLTDEYGYLVSLFSNGRRDYHNLTTTYVTGNSLLITAIAFLMGLLYENVSVALVIIPITWLGLWLCYNLKIAQGVLGSLNSYFIRELRIFEKRTAVLSRRYFSDYDDLLKARAKGRVEKLDDSDYGESDFVIYPWAKVYRYGFARRMHLFPLIFGFIYGLIMLYCIIYLHRYYFPIEKDLLTSIWPWINGVCYIALSQVIVIGIFRFLEPWCNPSDSSNLPLGCFFEKWLQSHERLYSFFYRTCTPKDE